MNIPKGWPEHRFVLVHMTPRAGRIVGRLVTEAIANRRSRCINKSSALKSAVVQLVTTDNETAEAAARRLYTDARRIAPRAASQLTSELLMAWNRATSSRFSQERIHQLAQRSLPLD